MCNPEPTEPFQRLDQCAGRPYPLWDYLRRAAWTVVQSTVFRWSPPRAFRWRRWLLRMFGADLGHHAYVRPAVVIIHPWKLVMGEWSSIADRVTVYNLGIVRIGRHTVISQDAYLCAGTHDFTKPDLPLQLTPITIGSGVWVCAGAFVCPNVMVGDNSIVAARAVVHKDVPTGVIVAGNPARVIKPRPMNPPGQTPGAT